MQRPLGDGPYGAAGHVETERSFRHATGERKWAGSSKIVHSFTARPEPLLCPNRLTLGRMISCEEQHSMSSLRCVMCELIHADAVVHGGYCMPWALEPSNGRAGLPRAPCWALDGTTSDGYWFIMPTTHHALV
jgi:hypothetical protein